MSVILKAVMLFYASIKFVHLASKHNPTVSSHTQAYAYDSTKEVDFKEDAVRVAFGVEGYIDGETKDDPNFVKYMVRMRGKREGVAYETILDYHVCTPEELDMFGTPSKESIRPLKKYKGDASGSSKQHLFCLDWDNIETGEVGVWGV